MEQFLQSYNSRFQRGREHQMISQLRQRSMSRPREEEPKPAPQEESKQASKPAPRQQQPRPQQQDQDEKLKKARDKLIMSLTSSSKKQKEKMNNITTQLNKTGFDPDKIDEKIKKQKKKISLLKQTKLLAGDDDIKSMIQEQSPQVEINKEDDDQVKE